MGGISSWFFQYHFGRRTIIIVGLLAMIPFMGLVACLDFVTSSGGKWAQAIMLMAWFYLYGSTQGPSTSWRDLSVV